MFLTQEMIDFLKQTKINEPVLSDQQKINMKARSYLQSTDWYIIRELESGIVCPQDIKSARAEARAQVVE